MKQLGRLPSRFPGKTDHHPKRHNAKNWWEVEIGCGGKNEDKLKCIKTIDAGISEYMYEKTDVGSKE